MTVAEAAEYLGISRNTVYYLIHENGLPIAGRIGKTKKSRYRFNKQDLDKWMRDNAEALRSSNGEAKKPD